MSKYFTTFVYTVVKILKPFNKRVYLNLGVKEILVDFICNITQNCTPVLHRQSNIGNKGLENKCPRADSLLFVYAHQSSKGLNKISIVFFKIMLELTELVMG